VFDDVHVPLSHVHWPLVQQAAAFPCLAQQVFGAQQMLFATPLPQVTLPAAS
jgi:hypothetical protein